MSDQPEQESVRARVVLEVSKVHVKAVKTALEKAGQLDRTSRITQGTSKDNNTATPETPTKKVAQEGIVPDSLHSDIAKSTHGASPDIPVATIQFPVLKFDVVSGQYVDPTVLQQEDPTTEAVEEQHMRIPTTIPYSLDTDMVDDTTQVHHDYKLKSAILEHLALGHLFQDVLISHQSVSPSPKISTSTKTPLQRALGVALEALPQSFLVSRGLTVEALVSSFPDSYSIYRPLLLLPHNAFASKAWKSLLVGHAADLDALRSIWQHIAEAVDATHIAVNSPIPLQKSTESAAFQHIVEPQAQENILRSPVNLAPIYGDFGPSPTTQTLSSPTDDDFRNALWVKTTQNGIHQTWAPIYTMFSRGNVREKSRILNLPSVTMDSDVPSAAIDLYAGIGYFAFSYKKSGAQGKNGIERILCWELNPWSVEGLRRGAVMNRWTYKIWNEKEMPGSEAGWEAWRQEREEEGKGKKNNEDFWIFQMSNESASGIVQQLNSPDPPLIPPIRHINLGLLPSSALSWRTAVRVLDVKRGGWIHAHENVGVTDIESRSRDIEMKFQGLLNECHGEGGAKGPGKNRGMRVKVEHVEKVKMYAPGVVHCVFDVCIEGAWQ